MHDNLTKDIYIRRNNFAFELIAVESPVREVVIWPADLFAIFSAKNTNTNTNTNTADQDKVYLLGCPFSSTSYWTCRQNGIKIEGTSQDFDHFYLVFRRIDDMMSFMIYDTSNNILKRTKVIYVK